MKSRRTKVFVIMPSHTHGGYKELRTLFQEWASERGMELHLPKFDVSAPSFDLSATLKEMRSAGLVLADLSYERPSSYFELGIAEALGKSIKVVARFGTAIHQTSYRNDVHFYKSANDLRTHLNAMHLDDD